MLKGLRLGFKKKRKIENTYRLYKYSDFLYDETVDSEISSLLKTYRDSFEPNLLNENHTFDNASALSLFPLTEEIKYYYNNDLCISVSTSISLYRKTNFKLREHSFHLENSIFRIANIWEYLFICLNQFLGVQMIVGHDLRNKIIEAKCHNIDFIKHGNGYKPIVTRLPEDIIDEIKPDIKRKQKLFDISTISKKNRFHKQVKRKYSSHENLQYIFDLYYCDEVKSLINIRNEIVHRRPICAKGSVAPLDFMPAQGISFNPNGWFNYEDIDVLLEKNIFALRGAVQMLIDLIFTNDIPNLKGNGNETFLVYKVKCNNCGKRLLINDITVETYEATDLEIICPHCNSADTTVGDTMEVHDQYYVDNIRCYGEFMMDYHKKREA